MKICPRCFAEYEEKDITEAYPCCIECYGDSNDIVLLDKAVFMERFSIEDFMAAQKKIQKSTHSIKTKEIILHRIDKLIKEKQN